MTTNRKKSLHALSIALSLWCVGCPEKKTAGDAEAKKKESRALPAAAGTLPQKATEAQKVEKDSSLDDALPPLTPAGDLTFDVRNDSLWVHSPVLGTSLTERAHGLTKSTVEGDTVTILYEDQFSCTHRKTLKKDVRYFQARLENTRAFRVYKEGKFAEAARGFQRAMQLDDSYGKARTNHIAALCRAGDVTAARSAFSAALKKDPVTTYEKLLEDSDFEPLRPEFRTKDKVEPVLRLLGDSLPNYAGYSKERGLLSVMRKEVSWGSEGWTAELHVFDADSRKLLSQHTLVRWHDTDEEGKIRPSLKEELNARLLRLSEALTALGFQRVPEEMHAEFNQPAPAKGAVEARLSPLGQSIVAEKDTLRLVRGTEVLDTFHSSLKGSRPSAVYGVPEMKSLIYFGAFEVAEGCDSGPESLLEVFATEHLGESQTKPQK